MLLRYLRRAAPPASPRPGWPSLGVDDPDDRVSAASPGDVGAFALVAGLNAGGGRAARRDRRQLRPARPRAAAEPTAAESARLAGVAAAELVVNGAGLHEVAGTAAGVAMNGWRIGLPDDPVDRIEYRARGLVGLVLVALELETRDPEPPGEPASCGALPGENLGRPFPAEITFTMGLAAAEIRSLSDDLAGLARRGHGLAGQPVAAVPRAHRPGR